MKSQLRKAEHVEVLVCGGNLDATHMVQLRDKMTRLMGRNRKRVLIDLHKARNVDLAGLGILVERLRKFRKLHGDIRLCNLRPNVLETFRFG